MVETPLSERDPCVSARFHKSVIEVNEKGTEVAVVTIGREVCCDKAQKGLCG